MSCLPPSVVNFLPSVENYSVDDSFSILGHLNSTLYPFVPLLAFHASLTLYPLHSHKMSSCPACIRPFAASCTGRDADRATSYVPLTLPAFKPAFEVNYKLDESKTVTPFPEMLCDAETIHYHQYPSLGYLDYRFDHYDRVFSRAVDFNKASGLAPAPDWLRDMVLQTGVLLSATKQCERTDNCYSLFLQHDPISNMVLFIVTGSQTPNANLEELPTPTCDHMGRWRLPVDEFTLESKQRMRYLKALPTQYTFGSAEFSPDFDFPRFAEWAQLMLEQLIVTMELDRRTVLRLRKELELFEIAKETQPMSLREQVMCRDNENWRRRMPETQGSE